jgi:hypothetical protein
LIIEDISDQTMAFDIYALDHYQDKWDDWDEALDDYTGALIDLFVDSPEGEAFYQQYENVGWLAQLISLGFTYQEVTLPEMQDSDIRSILFNHFPRKISVLSPDDVDDVIPELIAFWTYLQREYNLPHAEGVLTFLNQVDPNEFKAEMNNPANFGMARSFFQSGAEAGFDMTTQEGIQAFQKIYNASLGSPAPMSLPLSAEPLDNVPRSATSAKKSKSKQKRRNAMAKASRKQNRKKRKK